MIGDFFRGLGESIIDHGIEVYDACIGALYSLLTTSPAGGGAHSSASGFFTQAWQSVVNGPAYATLVSVGGALAIVFFLIGYCKESVDVTRICNIENNINVFIRLIIGVAAVSSIAVWLPKVVKAGVGVAMQLGNSNVTTIKASGISGQTILEGVSNDGVACFIGLIMFIMLVACGIGILYIGITRLLKLIVYACLAPAMLSTITGGSGINRTAGLWLRNFLSASFSNVTIIIAMIISTKLVGAPLMETAGKGFINGFLLCGETAAVLGFIKTAESMMDRLLGAG